MNLHYCEYKNLSRLLSRHCSALPDVLRTQRLPVHTHTVTFSRQHSQYLIVTLDLAKPLPEFFDFFSQMLIPVLRVSQQLCKVGLEIPIQHDSNQQGGMNKCGLSSLVDAAIQPSWIPQSPVPVNVCERSTRVSHTVTAQGAEDEVGS